MNEEDKGFAISDIKHSLDDTQERLELSDSELLELLDEIICENYDVE